MNKHCVYFARSLIYLNATSISFPTMRPNEETFTDSSKVMSGTSASDYL